MKKELVVAFTGFALFFIISLIFSIFLGFGEAEIEHDPSSIWMYVRRLMMLALAVISPMLTGQNLFRHIQWKISLRWVFISILLGILIGLNNRQGFNPLSVTALILGLFHTITTELYFRAYLYRMLSSVFKWEYSSLVISSLFYGLSYLTEYPVVYFGTLGRIGFGGLFLTLGLIFAYAYRRSGSFSVPLILHFLGVLRYKVFL